MRHYFFGWYMKCHSDSQTISMIPAVHRAGRKQTCSIQIITDDNVWTVPFPSGSFHQTGKKIVIDKNLFGENGICLAIHTPELMITGQLYFGPLSPLKYDIMGPFALVPFMECRHSILSMKHSVRGTLHINEETYYFKNGTGYWEGDRGRSFPKKYLWTQCCFPHRSLMLSVAEIPIAGLHFTGIICCILWKGNEYRLATYLGARLVQHENRKIRIIQRNLQLDAYLPESTSHPLKAPASGKMIRTIHENPSGKAFYQFRKNGHTLFAFETNQASIEYEY